MDRHRIVDEIVGRNGKPRSAAAESAPSAKRSTPSARPTAKRTTSRAHEIQNGTFAAPKAGKVPCFYDSGSGCYFAQNAYGEYLRYPKEELQLLLRRNGYHTLGKHADGLNYLESERLRILQENSVHFAGPLGGYQPGLYEIHTCRVLVTRGPKLLQPVDGRWDNFKAFLSMLLDDQARYFCAWMKVAYKAIDTGLPWHVGQLLAVAGPPGSGKSVLQSFITPMLGGRVSSPFDYISSATNFNAEIFGAEHGLIGDVNHEQTHKARRMLGAAIKNLVAEPVQKIHAKGKTGITLTPFLRVSLSLNDNPDSLTILPSFDSDVVGKIILLRARATDWKKLTARFANWHAWFAKVESELPAFLYHLRRWQIPESITDSRWGVVSFHDQELVDKLQRISIDQELLDTIDLYIFEDVERESWFGTSSQLMKQLREKVGPVVADKIAGSSARCGQLLSVLAGKYPERVTMRKGGKNVYVFEISRE
jgi:hypothetical protein